VKIHTMPQGTPEWKAARKGKISASEIGEFIISDRTETAKKARRNLALKKLAERADAYIADTFQNAAMKHGHAMEATAREAYRRYRRYAPDQIEEVGFCESDCGYFGCSPDGLVNGDVQGLGGVEIKCPSGEKHFAYLFDGNVPRDYYHQVHMSMAVTGRRWWDFVSFCPTTSDTLIPLFVARECWNADTDAILRGLHEMASMVGEYEVHASCIIENTLTDFSDGAYLLTQGEQEEAETELVI
jgi:hypothetical protein